MLIIALYQDTILTYEFMGPNENVDAYTFVRFLNNNLWKVIQQKRIRRPIILMDNARPHNNDVVKDFITERRWERLDHPPYSPDLNPCDSEAIYKIKKPLKGNRYTTPADLVAATDASIRSINGTKDIKGIYCLPMTWQQVIDVNGDYAV